MCKSLQKYAAFWLEHIPITEDKYDFE